MKVLIISTSGYKGIDVGKIPFVADAEFDKRGLWMVNGDCIPQVDEHHDYFRGSEWPFFPECLKEIAPE